MSCFDTDGDSDDSNDDDDRFGMWESYCPSHGGAKARLDPHIVSPTPALRPPTQRLDQHQPRFLSSASSSSLHAGGITQLSHITHSPSASMSAARSPNCRARARDSFLFSLLRLALVCLYRPSKRAVTAHSSPTRRRRRGKQTRMKNRHLPLVVGSSAPCLKREKR